MFNSFDGLSGNTNKRTTKAKPRSFSNPLSSSPLLFGSQAASQQLLKPLVAGVAENVSLGRPMTDVDSLPCLRKIFDDLRQCHEDVIRRCEENKTPMDNLFAQNAAYLDWYPKTIAGFAGSTLKDIRASFVSVHYKVADNGSLVNQRRELKDLYAIFTTNFEFLAKICALFSKFHHLKPLSTYHTLEHYPESQFFQYIQDQIIEAQISLDVPIDQQSKRLQPQGYLQPQAYQSHSGSESDSEGLSSLARELRLSSTAITPPEQYDSLMSEEKPTPAPVQQIRVVQHPVQTKILELRAVCLILGVVKFEYPTFMRLTETNEQLTKLKSTPSNEVDKVYALRLIDEIKLLETSIKPEMWDFQPSPMLEPACMFESAPVLSKSLSSILPTMYSSNFSQTYWRTTSDSKLGSDPSLAKRRKMDETSAGSSSDKKLNF